MGNIISVAHQIITLVLKAAPAHEGDTTPYYRMNQTESQTKTGSGN